MTANALNSLYGGSVAIARRTASDALCGNVGKQDRAQEVLTPDWILEAASQALGGIELDPCASTNPDNWFAKFSITEPGKFEGVVAGGAGCGVSADAKTIAWQAGRVFENPPFGDLQAWLGKAVECAAQGSKVVHLGPVRPHRRWWRPLVKRGQVVYLNYDVKFRGHKQAFPAPLCLVSFNCVIPWLGERETGRE